MRNDVVHLGCQRHASLVVTLRHHRSQPARALPAERVPFAEERRSTFPSSRIPALALTPSLALQGSSMAEAVPREHLRRTPGRQAVPHLVTVPPPPAFP